MSVEEPEEDYSDYENYEEIIDMTLEEVYAKGLHLDDPEKVREPKYFTKDLAKTIEKLTKVPYEVVQEFRDMEILSDPPMPDQMQWLRAIGATLSKERFLRRFLMRIKRERRIKLIENPGESKVDRYIRSMYENKEEGERLTVWQVQNKVEHFLGVRVSGRKIRKIRGSVYAIKSQRRKQKKD
ncbi:hypothetical protein [Geoalkalibacter halelectricus]|uniref:hypothetical protein n=1 Tax=Geoalkalibacter halelectricus TaxID=2847045 RepID=UPI00266FD562|nr:hypothetical protein [Geoalkalibacter halelectricus]MDO3380366.1 hypothetical protein [Geoalkalibacter halelectricus]